MTIKQFLNKHVEGYLFKDLRTMNKIKLHRRRKMGGVGYPMVATILAGMELLGGLLQSSRFNMSAAAGYSYFDNYWNNFFSRNEPKYSRFGNIFRQLIRNGIAHTFLTKTGIWITKDDAVNHLKMFTESRNNYMIVDVQELFQDFVNSYERFVRPIVYTAGFSSGISKSEMQLRLNEMISDYESQSNSMLSGLGTAPPLSPRLRAMISGASTVNYSGTISFYTGSGIR